MRDEERMLLVYVAGPYSGPSVLTVLGNMGDGDRAARLVFQAGFAPFCPWHDASYYMGMSRRERANLDVEFFQRQSMRFLEAADVVLLLDTWERSSGARAEKERAEELGIPCVVLDEETLKHGDVAGVQELIEGAVV
jgi:nucleoside 2-deoxyribosyltransferase